MCCFGSTESQAIKYAFEQGGHGRIGFENNRTLPNGDLALSNHQLISQTLNAAGINNNDLAMVDDLRQTFSQAVEV